MTAILQTKKDILHLVSSDKVVPVHNLTVCFCLINTLKL